ncbi:MAG: type II toxin-antitoxin system HicB family antitoxin [Spirochaetaceae bacterium]|jgi:predicted RNase H-like HicB family nuclease|nr:type II toxin-antitoxin system HicB family antitoxin [Spirochaetaceae bacterium]
MKYVYPAIFTPEEGNILVSVPDLPGLHTFGSSLAEALYMVQDAIEMWLWDAENKGEVIPPASSQREIARLCKFPDQFVNFVAADPDEYLWQHNTRAVKKTLSIPAWLDHQAEKANAPFSQILQQGLKEYLHIVQ